MALSQGATAHIPTYGIGTASLVFFDEGQIRITFDLGFDGYWALAEMVSIDADKNGSVDEDEAGG